MATSGVITSSLTAREVVETACELIGVKADGMVLGASDAVVGLKHLNWMLKGWQADGLGWLTQPVVVTCEAGAPTVDLADGLLRLENPFVRVGSADRALAVYSNSEYSAIPNKATPGTPLAVNVNRIVGALRVRVWPVPVTDTSLYADGVRIIEDVTSLSQNLDVPQEWTECVFYNLAKRLRPVFPGVDPKLGDLVEAEADRLFAKLSSFDEESGSLFFGPDNQG